MKERTKQNIISIRLDDELLENLKKDAQKEYRPLAMHIRKILIDYLVTKG
ncbi:ribbon-helix-helix protein, CopG family [Campylobacter mucosalis]|nr:ribbon-helix-helix protein, CopG family [Campylobacter mucosalis]